MLDTACRVFSRSSYRGATTAEIAREAGISEPILYRHFGSKRDLYLACLDEAWRAFREVAEHAIADDPVGCLGAIADALHGEGQPQFARRRPLDPGADRGAGRPGDREGAAAADPRGARLLRRRDPRRPAARRVARRPRRGRRGVDLRRAAACSRRSTAASAACSATTSSACAPSAGAGCSRPAPETAQKEKSPGCGTRGSPWSGGAPVGRLRRPWLCGPADPSDSSPLALPLHSAWRPAVVQGWLTLGALVRVCQVARSSDLRLPLVDPDFPRNHAPFGGLSYSGDCGSGQVSVHASLDR